MAIVVNILYTGKNGNAKKFSQEMIDRKIVEKIRNEDGNIKYEYYIPVDDPESVLLIDSWENQKALDIHHATPMMKEIMSLREKYDLHMEVNRYVSDEEGVPNHDEKFIRK